MRHLGLAKKTSLLHSTLVKGDILYPDSSHITFEQKQVLISNFAPFLVGSSDWLRGKHFFFVSAQLATDLSDQQWSLSQKLKMFCSLSKRKKEPKFKMNTCFYSDVLWLHLGYRISTLPSPLLCNFAETYGVKRLQS